MALGSRLDIRTAAQWPPFSFEAREASAGEKISIMSRHAFFAMTVAAVLFAASVRASDPVRIDASSDAAAKASFARMIEPLPAGKREELQIAILVLNMDGVSSAYEAIQNPSLRRPSIERIKDRVTGMTADEIIALSKEVTSIEVELHSR